MRAAVSRLDFVPKRESLQVSLEKGTLTFTPVPGKRTDLRDLVKRVEDAGYKVPGMKGTVTGKLTKWREFTALEVQGTGQVLVLHDTEVTRQMLERWGLGAMVRISGDFFSHADAPDSITVKEYIKP